MERNESNQSHFLTFEHWLFDPPWDRQYAFVTRTLPAVYHQTWPFRQRYQVATCPL
jgi:hypothetical protein